MNNVKAEEIDSYKRRKRILIIVLLLLLFFLFTITIKDKILSHPTTPEITESSQDWYESRVVEIEKDSFTTGKISYYLYCISASDSTEECTWQKTLTKNVEVTIPGTSYVFFKAVDEKGNESSASKACVVNIDGEAPNVINVEKIVSATSVEVKVIAEDLESGINKYYYKIDDGDYVESTDSSYTFEGLITDKEYEITIKIVDKVGNSKEVVFKTSTSKIEAIEDTTSEGTTSEGTTSEGNKNNTTNGDKTESENNGTTDGNTTEDKKEPEQVEEIPEISLSEVPTTFEYGETYVLPSSYKFGESGGEVVCRVDGIKGYSSTAEIMPGTHEIECSAISTKGTIAKVSKTVEINPAEEPEETWDGWIKMNLYYPETSISREWRLGKETETRTGNTDSGWQAYTGPITIKLTDVENVYIKYKMKDGTTVISAPSGRLVVDIEPDSYSLEGEAETKVVINYTSDAETKQYQINGGTWQDYTGEFSVGKDTAINARVIKETKVYDTEGNVQSIKKQTNYDSVYISEKVATGTGTTPGETTPGESETETVIGTGVNKGYSIVLGPNYASIPETVIEGPTITNKTPEIRSSTTIEITTEEEARKIYYKVGANNSYVEYSGEFGVDKNETIYSYYIRESDGQASQISSYRVQNIKAISMPYVKIDSDTTLSGLVKEMNITISGNNYDTLEYSFDNKIYETYSEPIKVSKNCTIYAKGTNENGSTIESLAITNIGEAPSPLEKYDVSIYVNPEKSEVEGLVNKAEVTIDYDARVESKYYKINDGEWQTYNGTFEVTRNETITAYGVSKTGSGEASKIIDYLTTGIASPVIRPSTTKGVYSLNVTITYDDNANVKRYKIGTGEWQDYTEPILVEDNETIYAYSENSLGDTSSSSYTITNIMAMPRYMMIDKGSYFILKLNYPSDSTESTREYKWTTDGEWLSYQSHGILLIKEEYKDIISEQDGVQVTDDEGNTVTYTEDYYVINQPISELMDNLFMRWDPVTPASPTITLNTNDPTRVLEASIEYDEVSSVKQYKIVDSKGTSEWKNYEGPIKVSENNTIIYARGITETEVVGNVGTKQITNIDEENPTIIAKGDFTSPKRKVAVTLVGKDNLQIDRVGYIEGEYNSEDAASHGLDIPNNTAFTVESNGKYTIYAEDAVGNITSEVIEITNIDLEAPDIYINNKTETMSDIAEVEIDYGDSVTKEYKIGTTGTYKNYTDTLTIKSNDVLSLANGDKTLTIYARGTDSAGNSEEVSEILYNLDVDAPSTPVINANSGYPVLTEYGVSYNDIATVSYDTRDDITNYYSIDNGTTWNVYKGQVKMSTGTLMAKSVKKTSGLTVSSSKTVAVPTDALEVAAYDGDFSTKIVAPSGPYAEWYYKYYYIMVDSSSWTDYARVTGLNVTLYMLDSNGNTLTSGSGSTSGASVLIPKNTVKIKIQIGTYSYTSANGYISEISIDTYPKVTDEKVYPTLSSNGIDEGYDLLTVTFHKSAVKKLYKINDGEWQEYISPIKLIYGSKVTIKSIDKNNYDGVVYTYTASKPSDALLDTAYDGNTNAGIYVGGNWNYPNATYYLNVDSSIWNYYAIFKGSGTTLTMLDSSGSTLSTGSANTSGASLLIPKNTKKIKVFIQAGMYSGAYLYEIYLNTTPSIVLDSAYAKLTSSGVIAPKNEVEFNYHPSAVNKLYQLNDGEWQNYEGKMILNYGDTIKAKSINKNNEESMIYSSTYNIPSDALSSSAYDNNDSTYVSSPSNTGTNTYYLDIDSDLWINYLKLKFISPSSDFYIYMLDADNNVLNSASYNSYSTISEKSILIFENTTRIKFVLTTKTNGSTTKLYNLSLDYSSSSIVPLAKINYAGPTITSKGVTNYSTNSATIDYFSTSYYTVDKKLYKLNDGEWQNYYNPILFSYGDKISAKSIDSNGNESGTYSCTTVSTKYDYVGSNAYDGNTSTYFKSTGSADNAYYYLNIDSSAWGGTLTYVRNRLSGSYCNGSLAILDANGSTLLETPYNGCDTNDNVVVTIPINSSFLRFKIQGNEVINEVSIKPLETSYSLETPVTYVDSPVITVENSDKWLTSKNVEISYPSGYTNEYSYDGETWNTYNGSITVTEPTTIFARAMSGEEVVSSSSYQITKVDSTTPTVSLDELPSSIVLGSDYSLPTSYSVNDNLSSGNVECLINNVAYTSTKTLPVGNYNVICTVTTGAGNTANVSKEFVVTEEGGSND